MNIYLKRIVTQQVIRPATNPLAERDDYYADYFETTTKFHPFPLEYKPPNESVLDQTLTVEPL